MSAALAGGGEALHLTFRAGGQALAVAIDEVDEVLPGGGLRPLPGTAPGIAGVRIHRGAIVGVIDLGVWTGEPGGGGEAVLILRGRPPLGLLASAVDAATRGAEGVAPRNGAPSLPLAGALRCARGMFWRLDVGALRRLLRAEGPDARGGDCGHEDPACR